MVCSSISHAALPVLRFFFPRLCFGRVCGRVRIRLSVISRGRTFIVWPFDRPTQGSGPAAIHIVTRVSASPKAKTRSKASTFPSPFVTSRTSGYSHQLHLPWQNSTEKAAQASKTSELCSRPQHKDRQTRATVPCLATLAPSARLPTVHSLRSGAALSPLKR